MHWMLSLWSLEHAVHRRVKFSFSLDRFIFLFIGISDDATIGRTVTKFRLPLRGCFFGPRLKLDPNIMMSRKRALTSY